MVAINAKMPTQPYGKPGTQPTFKRRRSRSHADAKAEQIGCYAGQRKFTRARHRKAAIPVTLNRPSGRKSRDFEVYVHFGGKRYFR
jgi:hypothetical protein